MGSMRSLMEVITRTLGVVLSQRLGTVSLVEILVSLLGREETTEGSSSLLSTGSTSGTRQYTEHCGSVGASVTEERA